MKLILSLLLLSTLTVMAAVPEYKRNSYDTNDEVTARNVVTNQVGGILLRGSNITAGVLNVNSSFNASDEATFQGQVTFGTATLPSAAWESSGILKSDGSTLGLATIGAGLTWDGTTLSASGGGSQTPWTSDIDAAQFRLTNAGVVMIRTNFLIGTNNVGGFARSGNAMIGILKNATDVLTSSNDFLRIVDVSTGDAEVLIVKNSGRVGIGTPNPAVNLDVPGTIAVGTLRPTNITGWVNPTSMTTRLPAAPVRHAIMGDSLSLDYRGTPNWPAAFSNDYPHLGLVFLTNASADGLKFTTLNDDYPTRMQPFSPSVTGVDTVLSVGGGVNDIAFGTNGAFLANQKIFYGLRAKTNGFLVVMSTVPEATTLTTTQRFELRACNNLLRFNASKFDYFVDWDVVFKPFVGTNTSDGIHPNAQQSSAMGKAYYDALITKAISGRPSMPDYLSVERIEINGGTTPQNRGLDNQMMIKSAAPFMHFEDTKLLNGAAIGTFSDYFYVAYRKGSGNFSGTNYFLLANANGVWFNQPLSASFTVAATNGFISLATNGPVAIGTTGWTNTFGKDAWVEFEGTGITFELYRANGTGAFTNAATVTSKGVPLQVGAKILFTAGTGITGAAWAR